MTNIHGVDRRTFLAGSAAVAGAATLSACGGNDKKGGSNTPAGTVELWGRGGTEGGKAWEDFIPKLESDTGVKIKFSQVQNFDQELQSRAQSKNLPDILVNDGVLMGTYQAQGLIQAINKADYPEASAIDEKLWDEAKTSDGKYYGIPFSRQTMIDVYRKDYLAKLGMEVPTDWDSYTKYLDACAKGDPDGNGKPNYGTNVAGSTKNGYMARWAMSYIWQGGGSFWTKGADGKFTVDTTSPATVAAVRWIQQLYGTPGRIQPGALTADTNASTPFFAEGTVGHTLAGPYNFAGFDKVIGKDKLIAAAPPKGAGDKSAVLAEGENIYISAATTKLEDVKKVINWLLSAKGQEAAMTNKVQPVVRVPVRNDLDAAKIYKDERWAVVQESLKTRSESFPAMADVTALKQEIAATLNKVCAAPASDPTPELEQLKGAIEKNFKSRGLL